MVNVFLNDEVYAKLRLLKNENETFSEVIIRKLDKEEIDNSKFLGCMSEKGVDNEKLAKKLIKELKGERRKREDKLNDLFN